MIPRFSLKQLLVVVAFAAVSSAALARPGYWWHASIVTTAVCLAIGMLIVALVSEPRLRAFASGWLLLANGYLAIVLGPWTSAHLAPQLLTTKALANLEAKWHANQLSPLLFQPAVADFDRDGSLDVWLTNSNMLIDQPAGGSGAMLWNLNNGRVISRPAWQHAGNYTVFHATAHWLVAVVLGQCGGWLAMALAREQTRKP